MESFGFEAFLMLSFEFLLDLLGINDAKLVSLNIGSLFTNHAFDFLSNLK